MLSEILTQLFTRDLGKLKEEINSYTNEADLWKIDGKIVNSGGNLALHVVGNLRHFFGAVLGGTGYIRDREAEFSSKGVPRSEILTGIDAALTEVNATLQGLDETAYASIYPIEVFGEPMTTGYFLMHLGAHLNYHLGQINYHRRLLNGENA
jgi:uncharacterized damage-inducible protein DinB